MIQTRSILNAACVGASLFALSGCDIAIALVESDSEFLSEEFLQDAAKAKAEFLALGPSPTLPTMGTGTYIGFGRIDLADTLYGPSGTQLIGQAQLDATFSGSGATVGGSVTNFSYRNNTVFAALREALESGDAAQVGTVVDEFKPASGELTVTANAITDPLFSADITGSIKTGTESFDFDGATTGQFYGDDAQVIRLTGTTPNGLTVNDGSTDRNAEITIIGAK